ncbi:MAG: sigma-70 family RNA polymerase sigma factor [Bacteroidota bacterium]
MYDRDHSIVTRVLAGEKRAYAELVDRHKDKATTLAMRMLKNREDAEEALQDAFIRAFHALPRFEWKSSFSTWFYRIVYNVCASALARKGEELHRSIDEETEGENFDPPSDILLPDAAYESAEFSRIVREEVDLLPPMYGSVFTLFVMQEMSYEEIVNVTRLSLSAVKVRLFRARALLRDAVAKRLGNEVAELHKEGVQES